MLTAQQTQPLHTARRRMWEAGMRGPAAHGSAPPLHQVPLLRLRAVAYAATQRKTETVSDIMPADRVVFTCQPDDTVEKALELLVQHRVSGLPVVDEGNVVVGVVSDYDLLALDIAGKGKGTPLFPSPDETWQAFKAVKLALSKGTGKRVRDVMTTKPLTVRSTTALDDATSLLLQKRIRRLPVVDEDGKLVGIISRSTIIKVALDHRKEAAAAAAAAAAGR